MAEKPFPIFDFSRGIQRKTSKFLQEDNQVSLAINADFSRIGAVQKQKGYSQKGNDVPTAGATSTTSTSTSTSTSSTTTSSSSTTTP